MLSPIRDAEPVAAPRRHFVFSGFKVSPAAAAGVGVQFAGEVHVGVADRRGGPGHDDVEPPLRQAQGGFERRAGRRGLPQRRSPSGLPARVLRAQLVTDVFKVSPFAAGELFVAPAQGGERLVVNLFVRLLHRVRFAASRFAVACKAAWYDRLEARLCQPRRNGGGRAARNGWTIPRSGRGPDGPRAGFGGRRASARAAGGCGQSAKISLDFSEMIVRVMFIVCPAKGGLLRRALLLRRVLVDNRIARWAEEGVRRARPGADAAGAPCCNNEFPARLPGIGHTSSIRRAGSSSISLTRTRKLTDSRPSTRRWS